MKYLMAIDAGTGSVRAVIFNTKGEEISFAQKEWVHKKEKDIPNSMSFDFEKNWELVKWCIDKSIKKANINPKNILSLSATSMREGIILYDKNGKEIWGVANVDARASNQVKYLKDRYKGIEQKFYNISGQTFALGAIPRILWLKENNKKIYKKVTTISMIGDWILAKLSNRIVVDPSNAGTTGIFNLKKRDWKKSMMDKIGLKSNIFPPCLETGTVILTVSNKETLLKSNTLVVAGGGDVQLGSAGLGVVEKNQVAILGGSFWQQVVNIPNDTKLPKDMNIRVNPHVIKGLSQAEGITFFSGLILRWFRDVFCDIEQLEAKKKNCDVYTILENKAKDIKAGSNGIMPIFSDDMKYGKWYHASPSFINLNIDKDICNKYTMFKSLQENACIVSNINLKKIKKFSKVSFDTIVFASGASKGSLWCQTLADVTNCKVVVPKVKEATALGAAMSAGIGAGVFKDMKDAVSKVVVFEKEYIPNKKNYIIYKKITKKWKKIYKEQLKLVDKNLTTSMWKAPGI
ncbi:MAG: autoinducer-2 kinase [Campylobacterota bacterium]|nr:autoinducer-2 kinase [Campylobacterota bacterium]